MSRDFTSVTYGGAGLESFSTYRGAARTRLSTRWDRTLPYNNGSIRSRMDLAEMRDRALEVYENNPVAKSLLQTEVTNVVADGYRLQAKGKNPDGTLAKDWNAEAEDRWNIWLDQADIRQVLTGSQLQRNAYRSSRRDGKGGFILVDDNGNSRLQFIPASKIVTPDPNVGDLNFAGGVEVDGALRPVNFHILDVDQTGKRTFSSVPAANFVYLLPELDDDLGIEGPSCYSTIFTKLDQLEGYVDGVAVAARMATIFGLLIKSDENPATFQGLKTIINADGNQQRAITLENGMIKLLGGKDAAVQVDAKQPMTQTPEFVRVLMRLIGLPFDMPLEMVALDSSVSTFATWRGQVLQYYRSCYAKMKFYKTHWSRIYQWWASRERKNQILGRPNSFITPFPALFFPHQLHSRAFAYTDPIRDPQSKFLQRDAGWISDQQISAEMGFDWEETQIQLAAADALRRQLNLPTDIRSTLSRDVISVRSTDPASVGGEDAGKAATEQDKKDGYVYPDGSEENDE